MRPVWRLLKKSRKRLRKDLTSCQREGKEKMNIRDICMAAKSIAGTEMRVGDVRLKEAGHCCSCWRGVGEGLNTYHFLNPLGYFRQSPKVEKV